MEIWPKVVKQMFSCKSVNWNITIFSPLNPANTVHSIHQRTLRLQTFLHMMSLIPDILCSISLTAALFLHLVVFFQKVNDRKEFDYFVGRHLLSPSTYIFFCLPDRETSKHSRIPYIWPGTAPVKTPPTQQT